MTITPEKRMIAKAILDVFGGQPQVYAFQDDKQRNSIDLLSSNDRPIQGVTSYATIGLFEHSIGYQLDEKSLRIEFVAACRSECDFFPNVLATCAFHIIHDAVACSYGEVFTNTVSMYDATLEMKHMVFLSPTLWAQAFEPIEWEDKLLTWLLAVPISEAELQFLHEQGADALEALFKEKGTAIDDMRRHSVV